MKNFKRFSIFALLFVLVIPMFFVGCKNSDKNLLATPSIIDIENGKIIFNKVENADYYTISINNNEFNVDIAYNKFVELIDATVHYDASKIFISGNSYSVKVKANSYDEKKKSSSYSSPYSYRHGESVSNPTNLKINGTTLTWDPVKNASYYLVKLITPNTGVIFDKTNPGQPITSDDSTSIENADLIEHTCNTNSFPFASILSTAGTYNFYVCAVYSGNLAYHKSEYVKAPIYSHIVDLAQPINGEVYNDLNNEWHVSSIIDIKSNAIKIQIENITQTFELNNTNPHIQQINETKNYLDINLTRCFEGLLNLAEMKKFKISTQSIFISPSASSKFYNDSIVSSDSILENNVSLTAPTLTLNSNVVSWNHVIEEIDNVSAYELIVCLENDIKCYSLEKNTTTMVISENFEAVALRAVGKGNYLSSPFSNFVSNNSTSQTALDINTANLTWNSVGDYYLVELNNTYQKLDTTTFPIESVNKRDFTFRVHSIKAGNQPQSSTLFNLSQKIKLGTPTNLKFNNFYELSFNPVENAVGYYIYIKSPTQDFVKLSELYTSTKINLTNEVCPDGEHSQYQVKVVAVADQYSKFINSDESEVESVTVITSLESPQFIKIDENNIPIITETQADTTKYFVRFKAVNNADRYDVLINNNLKSFTSTTTDSAVELKEGIYYVDVSNFIVAGNTYKIKIKAYSDRNFKPSESDEATYTLIKQLDMVDNIIISENNEVYTLTFDPVYNAVAYSIRIVKENNSNYSFEVNGVETTSFTVHSSNVIINNNYIQGAGIYYFYITALADANDGNYTNSKESATYGVVNKLATLNQPTNIKFNNASKDEYYISWTGDTNADYYDIQITNPYGVIYNTTSILDHHNINQYINVMGNYKFKITARVNPLSENGLLYTSSVPSEKDTYYKYLLPHDFDRYSVAMYGNEYNFNIKTIDDLKNILWYNYLYEINPDDGLRILITQETGKTLNETLISFAEESSNSGLYDFKNDTEWNTLTSQTSLDTALLEYISRKLLEMYPEFSVLENLNVNALYNDFGIKVSNAFNLVYKNNFNVEKEKVANSITVNSKTATLSVNKNYGNDLTYIAPSARKSATGYFAIDAKTETFVETTEQLLQAVQNNKKPKFVGNSTTAENVYNNAKLVLSSIISNRMTDLQKVEAIFNWLEYGYDLTYYTYDGKKYISGMLENDNKDFAKYEHYYLEGIFNNISSDSDGNIIINNNFATSQSYSKAFTLLCAIEGIESIVVNGSYQYYDSRQSKPAEPIYSYADHVWNKVYLNLDGDNKWYNVDLTFSDNRIVFSDYTAGYGVSAHTYFLVSDDEINLNTKGSADNSTTANYQEKIYRFDEMNLIDENYRSGHTSNESYDYYLNHKVSLKTEQLPYGLPNTYDNGFSYLLHFVDYEAEDPNGYIKFMENYGNWKNFYVGLILYGNYLAENNSNNRGVVEFSFSSSNTGDAFDVGAFNEVKRDFSLRALSVKHKSYFQVLKSNTGNHKVVLVFVE